MSPTAARIRADRIAVGLSQERLAWLAGLTRTTVERLESGRSKPRAFTVWRLEKTLMVELEAARLRRQLDAWGS